MQAWAFSGGKLCRAACPALPALSRAGLRGLRCLELRRRFPWVGDIAVGASFCPEDGHANPRLVSPAFALSGFYLGIAGALWAFTYLGTVEPHGFDLSRSFQILFSNSWVMPNQVSLADSVRVLPLTDPASRQLHRRMNQ